MYRRVHSPWREHGKLFREVGEEIGQTARLVFSNAALGNLDSKKMEKIHKAFEHFREGLKKIISVS